MLCYAMLCYAILAAAQAPVQAAVQAAAPAAAQAAAQTAVQAVAPATAQTADGQANLFRAGAAGIQGGGFCVASHPALIYRLYITYAMYIIWTGWVDRPPLPYGPFWPSPRKTSTFKLHEM